MRLMRIGAKAFLGMHRDAAEAGTHSIPYLVVLAAGSY